MTSFGATPCTIWTPFLNLGRGFLDLRGPAMKVRDVHPESRIVPHARHAGFGSVSFISMSFLAATLLHSSIKCAEVAGAADEYRCAEVARKFSRALTAGSAIWVTLSADGIFCLMVVSDHDDCQALSRLSGRNEVCKHVIGMCYSDAS